MLKIALVACSLISAPLSAQNTDINASFPSTIMVVARGEVKVSPDRAAIQISVQTKAPTAAAAASQNAVKLKSVIDAIRALGLAANQVTTSSYNVYPEQRYQPNREPVIVGYNVTNTLLVEVRTLTQVGPVIDAALAKGANMVTSLQFFASNTEAARREAIALAIQKAKAEAEAAARAAGGTLGSIIEIGIGAYHPPPPRPPMMMRSTAGDVAAMADTPISPGEQTVAVEVTTRWSLVGGTR
ncbi:MAG: SIMPL domain-containing protein [Gemmatimonadaceae bacterium]